MLWITPKTGNRVNESLKVSSRVKIIIFRNLQFLNDYIELIKSFLKKKSRKKCFFFADLWSAKVFSMLIILIDRWQVPSYFIRIPLLNQSNHAIWQKSLSISIVLAVFPGFWKWMPPKKKKRACPFSSSNYELEVGYTHEKSNCPMSNTFMPLLAVRGGSRGRVKGVRRGPPPPPPPRDDLCFSNTTGILRKKNYVVYWCWSRATDECTLS